MRKLHAMCPPAAADLRVRYHRGMKKASPKQDTRLTRLTKICLALPETTRDDMGRHARFQVRKKVFAYFLDDHHGDGIVGVTCKVLPGDNQLLLNPILRNSICLLMLDREAGSGCGSMRARSTGRKSQSW